MSTSTRRIEPSCPGFAASACLLHLPHVSHSAECTHDITCTFRDISPSWMTARSNSFTLAECPDNDRRVCPTRDGRGDRSRERLRGRASLAWVLHGRMSEFWCGPRNDRKRHIVAVRPEAEPYRLSTRSNQSLPLHYCIEQRRLANIGAPCRGLACLSDGVLEGSGVSGFCTANQPVTTTFQIMFVRANDIEQSSLPQEAALSAEWTTQNPLRRRIPRCLVKMDL